MLRSALSLPHKRVATQAIRVQILQYSDGIPLAYSPEPCITMCQPGPLSERLQRHPPPQDRSKRYSSSREEVDQVHGTKSKPWSFRQHNVSLSGVVSLNLRLGQSADIGHSVKLLETLKEMKERGIRPDILTYNSVMEFLAKHAMEDEAWALVDDMKALGVMPDIETYKFLLKVR
jgi:pentatricopeptide repeat protein